MNVAALVAIGVLFAGCAAPVRDDRHPAFKEAERFATLLFVDEQFDEAYAMLSEEEQALTELSDFSAAVASQRVRESVGLPANVIATEYRFFGRRNTGHSYDCILVYLVGDQQPQAARYRISMCYAATRWSPTSAEVSREAFPDFGKARHPVGPVVLRAGEQEDAADEGREEVLIDGPLH